MLGGDCQASSIQLQNREIPRHSKRAKSARTKDKGNSHEIATVQTVAVKTEPELCGATAMQNCEPLGAAFA